MQRLLAEAAGNPLALLELPSGLSDAQLAGHAELRMALPLSARLRAVFVHRIVQLPDSTRAALLVAAAADADTLSTIVQAGAVLGLPEDALDPAHEEGLVRGCRPRQGLRYANRAVEIAPIASSSRSSASPEHYERGS